MTRKSKLATLICSNCEKRKPNAWYREVYLKNYIGPCGDSFCYASCDMAACRPVRVVLCDVCTKKVSK